MIVPEGPGPAERKESDEDEQPVRWFDPEEQRAWRAVIRATLILRQAMEEALDAHGVSFGEYELLSMVSEAPGARMRMSRLADLIVQSRSRLSHTATRLERRGWVRRDPATEDGRGVLLVLTAEGLRKVQQLAPVHVESIRRGLVDPMSRDEFLAYGELMARVVRATRGQNQAGDVD